MIRLKDDDPVLTLDADRVAKLANGILQSFKFAQIETTEALAALTTAMSHISLNALDKSSIRLCERNRTLMLDALSKVQKRILAWKPKDESESSSQDVSQTFNG